MTPDMNQLCVPVPSASNTHQILEDVFKLCRVPWIFDFIFRADPAADISMLLAPVQKRHALSARIFFNATETSSRYAHTFDFTKELVFYSIPAFSIGPITAGFCVEQPAHLATRDARDSLQCIRFIRDDRAGVFLHVSENASTGVTEVDCLTHKSSTRRTRVRMKFDMHSLRTVLRTPRGILHPTDISPSLIYLNVADEKRSCPVCKDPTATHCDCILPLRRPHHPLDFQFEAGNMGLYTGFYQGATVVRLCSAGHCIINATLQSASVIQGELNADITTRMHKLAVADRLSKVKEKPSALVMPASPLDLSAILAGEVPEEAKALADEMDESPDSKTPPLDTDGLFADTPDVTDAPDVGGGEIDGTGVLMDTGDMLVTLNEPAACPSSMRSQEETPTLNVLDDENRRKARGVEDEGGGGDGGRDIALQMPDVENGTSELNSGAEEIGAEQDISPALDKREDQNKSERNEVVSPAVPNGERLTARSIADKCASWVSRSSKRIARDGEEKSTSPDMHIDEDSGTGKSADERRSRAGGARTKGGGTQTATSGPNELDKAEIRKKRNREAAARSNLKRKLRNESVRRDLASLTQRAIRLRVKEMMLRDENTRLRNALRRAGTTHPRR